MSAEVVSTRVVHAWISDSRVIFHVSKSFLLKDSCEITAAAVSFQGPPCVWIGLRDGRIVRILAEVHEKQKSICIDSYLDGKATCTAPVGELMGLLCSPSSRGVDAYGTTSWCTVKEGGQLDYSETWPNPMFALQHAIILSEGALRDTIIPSESHVCAFLTCDVSGRVALSTGSSLSEIMKRRRSSPVPIVDLGQRVVSLKMNAGGSVVVAVGALRAFCVFYAQQTVKTARGLLRGSQSPLTSQSLLIRSLDNGIILLQEEGNRNVTEVVQLKETGELRFVHRECQLNSFSASYTPLQARNGDGQQLSQAFRSLLRGIEDAGSLEQSARHRGAVADDRIRSFNSALLFALDSKAWDNERQTTDAKLCCTFAASLFPAPGSSPFYPPGNWTGTQAFIDVQFCNKTGRGVGNGWNVKLTLEYEQAPDVANQGLSTCMANTLLLKDRCSPGASRLSILTCAMNALQPGGKCTLSFPVVLETHAPMFASVCLYYSCPEGHEEFARCGMSDELPAQHGRKLEIPLANRYQMDILHFASQRSGTVDGKITTIDDSHKKMRLVRLLHYIESEQIHSMDPLQMTSQFVLPLSVAAVHERLDLTKEKESAYKSFLGASFSIELSPASAPNAGPQCCVVLRAVPAVIDFVRAAVLRRIATGIREGHLDVPTVGARSATAASEWGSGLADKADSCLPALRRAEKRLGQVKRLQTLIDEGELEHCARGDDSVLTRWTRNEMSQAHLLLRQKLQDMWTP